MRRRARLRDTRVANVTRAKRPSDECCGSMTILYDVTILLLATILCKLLISSIDSSMDVFSHGFPSEEAGIGGVLVQSFYRCIDAVAG